MISLISRQGLGRLAVYNGFNLPNILFLDEDNIEGGIIEKTDGVLDILGNKIELPGIEDISKSQLEDKYFVYGDIVVLPGLFTLLKRPERLIEKIINVRLEVDLKRIVYAPFIAEKYLVPVLHYLGIDLLDSHRVRLNSENVEDLWEMEKITRRYMEKGDLRVLVESIPDPLSKTLLRLSDMYYYSLFEKFFPVSGRYLNSSHFESLFRPDIRRWRERIIERYRRPGNERYILLLPCSATKPYSRSPSHRYLRSIVDKSGKHLHEVIVTSPLGLVPRELEFTYPAAHYDIPVTGRWYGEEREFTMEMLKKFLDINKYERIIAFLPEDLNFLDEVLEKWDAIKIFGNLRDENNKNVLLDALNTLENSNENIVEKLNSIARFQFGVNFPLNDKKIRKRYDEIIAYENDIYIHFSPMHGKILLGRGGAEFIASRGIYTVEIDNFTPKGSVFVSGIIKSTEDIREGDEVVILRGGDVIGTGTATMSHEDMESQEHGEAVKVRKIFNSS